MYPLPHAWTAVYGFGTSAAPVVGAVLGRVGVSEGAGEFGPGVAAGALLRPGDGVDTAVVEAASAERVALRWHEPRRRVAAGQSVVLYDHTGDDATVLAGGVAS